MKVEVTHPSASKKSFDFIQVIKAWIEDIPIKVKFRKISGHQLKHQSYKDLDWWEQRNRCGQRGRKNSMFLHPALYKEKWSISVDKIKLTHLERKNLYTRIYGRSTIEYWHKKDSVLMDPEQID